MELFEQGYDIVSPQTTARENERLFKRWASALFYRAVSCPADQRMTLGDFAGSAQDGRRSPWRMRRYVDSRRAHNRCAHKQNCPRPLDVEWPDLLHGLRENLGSFLWRQEVKMVAV